MRAAVRSRHSHQLARDRPRGGVQGADARQAREDRLGVALVARALERLALLARPLQPAELAQATFELRRELEQVHDVLARVGELLGRERTRVPAREARGLRHAHAEHLAQQRVVRGLRAEPDEAGRDLRVEDVAHLGAEAPAHERDVLASGVHDDLDRGVGEHRGERRAVEVLGAAGR